MQRKEMEYEEMDQVETIPFFSLPSFKGKGKWWKKDTVSSSSFLFNFLIHPATTEIQGTEKWFKYQLLLLSN